MAMDHFLEEVAVKRNNTLNRILYYLSWVMIVIFALIASMMLSTLTMNFNWITLVIVLVSAGMAVYVESFGKVSSSSFQRYLGMPGIKRMNWFLNRDAELYYFYFTKDSAKKMIIFEPSEEMVNTIKQYLPHGVYQE